MKKLSQISLILLFLLGSCTYQSAESGKPKQIDNTYYSEQHRPQFHFTPDSMWMNDPNGLVYFEGEYHLFYQYYPEDIVWGPMHWGHAISTDLVHWEHLPIALYPDSLGFIFSGSAIIDWKNTSGLQNGEFPPMIAIFTHHNMEGERAGSNTFQNQSIAYSNDKGRSWKKYKGNPVLRNPGIRDFRDPKVVWFEKNKKWIMVFAAHDRVMFYSSPNLTEWKKESEFGVNTGAHGGVWECPDLMPMEYNGEEKWVLLVSLNPGGPNGGSCTQYFVGDYDGSVFTNENPGPEPLWMDYGKDNYAGVTFSDIPEEDGRRILIGWMSNWQYATSVPTERWRSAMTIPRELVLNKDEGYFELYSKPVQELDQLRDADVQLVASVVSGSLDITDIDEFKSSMYEINLEFKLNNDSQFGMASDFGFVLSNELNEHLIIGYNTSDENLYIDRTLSGKKAFSDQFPGIHRAPLKIDASETLKIRAFVDKSSIELFVNDGECVMTEIFFPNEDFDHFSLFADNGSVKLKSGTIYSLNSTW